MRALFLLVGGVTVIACASIPRGAIDPLRPGELAGSGWTVMGSLDERLSGQRFVADGTTIRSVLVPVVPANPAGFADGVVTMTLVDPSGAALARVRQVLPATEGWARFPLPEDGLTLPAGSVVFLWMSNRGNPMFGWRYQASPTLSGGAFVLGKSDPRSDFIYRLESSDAAPPESAPVAVAKGGTASPASPGAAQLVAHYPLVKDLRDATGRNLPLAVENATLDPARGLFCGGSRAIAGSRTCDVRTPRLSAELASSFTVSAQFLVPDRQPIANPVFVGGLLRRWVAYELQPDGGVRLIYSNSLRVDCSVRYRTGVQHEGAITYDGRTIRLYLDARPGCAVNAPLDIGTDTVILLTNTANASTFYGYLRELRVYSGVAVPEPPATPGTAR